jgi:uncharacterized protein YndB with AHSA1/START domain
MMADVTVSRQVVAPAEVTWALLADLSRMPEWSPENERVEWLDGATDAAPGARFQGTNRNGAKTWKSVGKIIVFEPGRALAFHVKAGPFNVADWRYTIEPDGNVCRVTESWTDRRNGAMRIVSKLVTGVEDRPSHNRDGMEETLRRLSAAAETCVTD